MADIYIYILVRLGLEFLFDPNHHSQFIGLRLRADHNSSSFQSRFRLAPPHQREKRASET